MRQAIKKILFIGYNPKEIDAFKGKIFDDLDVEHNNDKLANPSYLDSFDLVVSYGYRYLIPKSLLDAIHIPVINLHISLLPFNRGAHPNFWSFYDGTPSGVSIHMIDEGMDTGDIIAQERFFIDPKENTFKTSYDFLNAKVQALFVKIFPDLTSGNYKTFPQKGISSQHVMDDLPKGFRGWECNIYDEIKRLKSK